ncbi:MAG: pilus assembly protein [Anaerolineae bacterium]|nr:pilus assembly protein [Anaerolineae bacterium]
MGGKATRSRGNRTLRGQSLVELAALLPVLIVVLLGIAEFSRLRYAYITVDNAARVGAQYGAQSEEATHDVGGLRRPSARKSPPSLT